MIHGTDQDRINQERYPIHFRLADIKETIDALTRFLAWYVEQGGELIDNVEVLINEYYEIDPVAQQHELLAMIQEQEAAGAESTGIETDSEPPPAPETLDLRKR